MRKTHATVDTGPWSTSFAMRYIAEINTFWIDFHSCAHGRRRDKLTRLWSNKDWRSSLQLSCDKMHPHASCRPSIVDGKLSFPTTEEAAYPWLFRERVVRLVEGIAIDSGYTVLTSLQEQVQARHLTTFQRNVFDALPREAVRVQVLQSLDATSPWV